MFAFHGTDCHIKPLRTRSTSQDGMESTHPCSRVNQLLQMDRNGRLQLQICVHRFIRYIQNIIYLSLIQRISVYWGLQWVVDIFWIVYWFSRARDLQRFYGIRNIDFDYESYLLLNVPNQRQHWSLGHQSGSRKHQRKPESKLTQSYLNPK